MTCLLKQQDCGLMAGDTQCGKCGLRPGEGFPTREDRDQATLKATAQYWQNHTKELEARNKKPPATPVATSSSHAVGEVFKDLPVGPEMVVIPSGSFMMGSNEEYSSGHSDAHPSHLVRIDYRFAIGKNPVTFDEWDAYTQETDAYNPDDNEWGRGRRPVINVSWNDAQAYIQWLNKRTGKKYRLLSEAEWEYAARAGTTTSFYTGEKITVYQANITDGDLSRRHTTEVDDFKPNPWGLHDMLGNVWEWVQDGHMVSYVGSPSDGSPWESDTAKRVLRGGSWNNCSRNRVWVRVCRSPDVRKDHFGFRLARTLP